jgi:RNA polymerase sigma factor (sigma-70 family)
MSFPETRQTFVERLASQGSEEDWRCFLQDYWGPVCRFALRWGAGNLADAEDVAAQTFEVLWENRLLVRWVSNRSARLRSLLCGVVRKTLANRGRTRENRQRLGRELAEHVEQIYVAQDDQADAFYAAWAEGLLQRAVESLAAEYYRQAKGDYVRVLYGRLCQGLSVPEVARSLEISISAADNYFRHAKTRLAEKLADEVRQQVHRYSPPEDIEREAAMEWRQLGQHLEGHGGLEEAVRRTYELLDPVAASQRQRTAVAKTLTRLTAIESPPNASDRSGGTS